MILKLEREHYAIATPHVQTMVAMPEITSLPYQPTWSRGVINLRGQVMPLVDLRLRLGITSYLAKIEGLMEMVRHREADHLNWLAELEKSVREKREFALTTDPHKCKFGQWYDHYKPVSLTETQLLQQFDAPHRRIHGLAEKVRCLVAENKADEALAMIEKTRDGDFATMRNLFGSFFKLMQEMANTEIAVVLANTNRRAAIAVDAIESVEMLAEGSVEEMPEALQQEGKLFAPYVAKRKKTGDIVSLLDAHRSSRRRDQDWGCAPVEGRQARIVRMMVSAGSLLQTLHDAPAWRICWLTCSSSCIDNPMTHTSGNSSCTILVASMPFIPGMLTSISTTSGCRRRTSSTPALPSEASPDDLETLFFASKVAKPCRSTAWSSTRAMRRRSPCAPGSPSPRKKRIRRIWSNVMRGPMTRFRNLRHSRNQKGQTGAMAGPGIYFHVSSKQFQPFPDGKQAKSAMQFAPASSRCGSNPSPSSATDTIDRAL